jgi:hypothetical protein
MKIPSHRTLLGPALLVVLAGMLSGCFTSGAFLAGNVTDVQLKEANYEVVATDVHGSATAGYILGVSGGLGPSSTALALARVSGDGPLYQAALADLWQTVRDQHGEVEGRNLALVNVRYDVEALNLILYTQPTLTVRADIVEFTE